MDGNTLNNKLGKKSFLYLSCSCFLALFLFLLIHKPAFASGCGGCGNCNCDMRSYNYGLGDGFGARIPRKSPCNSCVNCDRVYGYNPVECGACYPCSPIKTCGKCIPRKKYCPGTEKNCCGGDCDWRIFGCYKGSCCEPCTVGCHSELSCGTCYSCRVEYKKKCHRVRHKKRHHRSKTRIAKQEVIVEEEPVQDPGLLVSSRKIVCPPYSPVKKYACVVMYPGDIVDLTCKEFTKKVSDCQPYTCQAPNAQDPSIKTVWNIEEKIGDERCRISNTTDYVGLKDNDGKPIPVTQTCEYDKVGIVGLAQRLLDMRSRFYQATTDENFEGIHNCVFTVSGIPIKDALNTIRFSN